MRNIIVVFCLLLIINVHVNEASRILCIFPFQGKSHFGMFETLCKALARKGHQVDMISHFPTKKPIANYTDIVDLSGTKKITVNRYSIEHAKNIHAAVLHYLTVNFGTAVCELMGHDRMKPFIQNARNNPKYDLIITEYFGFPCYLGFGELLNAPVAIAVSFTELPVLIDFMGGPQNYAFIPGFYTTEPEINTFFDRLWNFVINYISIHEFYYHTRIQTEMMRKHLNLPNAPDVRELERKVSLALVNSHHTFTGVRPMTPAMVDIGGIHIYNEYPPLSSDIKEWVDSATDGLVYFTFGSQINIETLPRETILSLYASFAKISPVKVLMKCANATKLPPGLPSNTITSPWISQIAVLKHKNTRVFITHGGLMGTQEAFHFGVPMIGIPIFGDQEKNVKLLVHKNMAVLINIDNINEKSMDAALNAVLHDPKYRESAKNAARLFRDRPLNPVDTGVYWVEYIIRNGPNSLRSPALDLPWWKLSLVDVFAFLIVCLVLVIYFSTILLRIALRRLRQSYDQTKQKIN